ncbi:MAG: hypothetical protein CMG94_03620 [Marinoscillum sp.]|nr:hypothetical protein [Marinoscillum sp.]OUX26715.1 MAG: hypothetical protein CBE22_02115 [Flammeovirgaceae bacterium TMED262]
MKKYYPLLLFFIFNTYDVLSQGCSMCRGIVESDANSGGTGISSSINSGIIFLFTSTYVLIIIGGVFWYFRSRKYVKDQESKRKIKKRVASLVD